MLRVCKVLVLICLAAAIGFGAGWWHISTYGRCTLTPQRSCIGTLKQLEGAKLTWAVEYKYGQHTNDVPTWSEIIGKGNYFATKPECPEGGTYTLGAAGEPPRCTVAGHVLP